MPRNCRRKAQISMETKIDWLPHAGSHLSNKPVGLNPMGRKRQPCMIGFMKTPNQQNKRNNTKLGAGAAILLLAAQSAWAQDSAVTDPSLHADGVSPYHHCELSLDGFGSASLGESTLDHLSGDRVRHNARLGAGLGLNYFFTRCLGVGIEADSENTDGVFVDNAAANLILRLPIGDSGLAPYIFGGGGHQFGQTKQWFGQAGAGLEYRFTPHIGLFVDARGVVPNETKVYGVGRLGMTFAF